ncbi:MAG: hypothetical protein ACPIOQ_36910, partial [Promethearchaeia archaeon]
HSASFHCQPTPAGPEETNRTGLGMYHAMSASKERASLTPKHGLSRCLSHFLRSPCVVVQAMRAARSSSIQNFVRLRRQLHPMDQKK